MTEAEQQDRGRDRRRHRRRTRGVAGADERGLYRGARRAAHGDAAGDPEARRQCRQEPVRFRRHDRSRLDRGPVRQGDGGLRPARRAVQQCRHGRAAGAISRISAWRSGRRWSNTNLTGAVSVHPARLPHHEGPDPARRPHHQQRLDLGARAAAVLGGLYLDQARHHRPDQGQQPRRPHVRHRGRPGRHRQCRDPDDRPHGRTACCSPTAARFRSRAWTPRRSAMPWPTWRACRSTPTCCS